MAAGTSHRFQCAPVLLVTEAVASGIYEQPTFQPRPPTFTVAVCNLYMTGSKLYKPVRGLSADSIGQSESSIERLSCLMKVESPGCRKF